jgi:purine nucleosidase
MSRTFVIDTDTASDDSVALVMALRSPEVRVAAITVVSGNVPVDQGVHNALVTVELCGSDTPVYRGAARPIDREPVYGHFFHGQDGLGDVGYPPPRGRPHDGDAHQVLIETIRESPGLVLVTLGPLTNVALAVQRAPDIVSLVDRCVVMGGAACAVGNVTPAAEFNLWVDPEAARIVFRSGLPIEMVGWELCRKEANLLPHEMDFVRSFDTPLAHFALDCNRKALEANRRQSGDPGLGLPDPVAMAIALDPTVCTRRSRHYVDIETRGELTRGMSVVDPLGVTHDERNADIWQPVRARGAENALVCWEIDIPRWKQLLYAALRES